MVKMRVMIAWSPMYWLLLCFEADWGLTVYFVTTLQNSNYKSILKYEFKIMNCKKWCMCLLNLFELQIRSLILDHY